MSSDHSVHFSSSAPRAFQIGFAGSRRLLDSMAYPGADEAAFHREIEDHLVTILEELPRNLCLPQHQPLCSISALAIGADTLFTRACARQKVPMNQRIFLPELREVFLAARGPDG